MASMPDVLGMKLEHAEEKLREAGVGYTVKTLRPPAGAKLPDDTETRVIRQTRLPDGGAVLFVCEV